jgi:hypothetical protein
MAFRDNLSFPNSRVNNPCVITHKRAVHINFAAEVLNHANLQVFVNSVLREIFERKWETMTEGWRKLLTKSFVICSQVLKYHSGEQIWDTEISEACGLYRENRNSCRVTGREN